MFKRRMKNRLNAIEKKLLPPRVGASGLNQTERPVIQLTHPIFDPSLVIGFDDEARQIGEWLMASKEEDRDVITGIGIVGSCGCGKTALAQKVFASPRIKEEFSPRIWVCLSNMLFENGSPKLGIRVVNCMLDAIDPLRKSNDSDSYDSLVKLLEDLQLSLTKKKYLIVLDNAWRFDNWYAGVGGDTYLGTAELLSRSLPKSSGGAVIVTSRREDVIRAVVGDEHLIRLGRRIIRNDICWDIFATTVEQQGKMQINHPRLSQIKPDVKRSFDVSLF